MFFAPQGKYEPCKMFTIGHLIFLLITIVGISIALRFTKKETILQKDINGDYPLLCAVRNGDFDSIELLI